MELKEKVIMLIADVEKTHRYSMSRIYGLYNEVFSVAESPQSCASCLIRKVNQLKAWLAQQTKEPYIQPDEVVKTRGRKPKQKL